MREREREKGRDKRETKYAFAKILLKDNTPYSNFPLARGIDQFFQHWLRGKMATAKETMLLRNK